MIVTSMSATKMIDMSFPGYHFMECEYCAFMCDDNVEIVCVVQEAFFNCH